MHRGEESQEQIHRGRFARARKHNYHDMSRLHMHVMSSKLVLSGQYNGLIGTHPNAGVPGADPHTDVHEQPAVKAVIT